MFGDYALYTDGQVVAPVCDDFLQVKMLPASAKMETLCEQGQPSRLPDCGDGGVAAKTSATSETEPLVSRLLRLVRPWFVCLTRPQIQHLNERMYAFSQEVCARFSTVCRVILSNVMSLHRRTGCPSNRVNSSFSLGGANHPPRFDSHPVR